MILGGGGKSHRKGTTNSGRVIITTTGEEPKSSRRSDRHFQLWKFAETLTPEEVSVMITKRRKEIKYENDYEEIKELKTDILILEDAYKILKRKMKEE